MPDKKSLYFVLFIWALVFGAAFVALFVTEPIQAGWTKGYNIAEIFSKWQIGATILAVVAWLLGLKFPHGSKIQWLSRVPALAFVVLLVTIALILSYYSYATTSLPQ